MRNKIIVITDEQLLPDEPSLLVDLLEAGAFRIHIRKPQVTVEKMRALLEQIPEKYHIYLSIHDHFELVQEFKQVGIHINSRNQNAPIGFDGCLSASCHTEEELRHNKPHCYYVFLSPCFNSISKAGYKARFSEDELLKYSYAASIDSKVFALGGITQETMKKVVRIGFGGACVLGSLWEPYKKDRDRNSLIDRLKQLQDV